MQISVTEAHFIHRESITIEYCICIVYPLKLQHKQVRNVKLHMQMELSTKLPLSKSILFLLSLSSFPLYRLTLFLRSLSRYTVIFSHKIKVTFKNGLKFKCCCSSQTTKAMIEIEVSVNLPCSRELEIL